MLQVCSLAQVANLSIMNVPFLVAFNSGSKESLVVYYGLAMDVQILKASLVDVQ